MWGILIISVFVIWRSFFQFIENPEMLKLSPFYQYFLIFTFILIGILLPILFWISYLQIMVTTSGIWYRFVPFQLKKRFIEFSRISGYEKIKYRPLLEYGGWGVRYGKNGMAYSVSGNMGVKIELKQGRSLLLGSQKSEELKNAIQSAIQHIQ